MVTPREIKGSGRPGSLIERLHERNPEPVFKRFVAVVNQSENLAVNIWEGFVADIECKVNNTSASRNYQLIAGDGSILDEQVISDGGSLRFFFQGAETPLIFAVVPDGAATFDFNLYVLRHRITGVV